jgi:hypothetical protein
VKASGQEDSEGHCQDCQTKGQRNANKTDAQVRKGSGKDSAAGLPRTNQNIPKNSAPYFFMLSPFNR